MAVVVVVAVVAGLCAFKVAAICGRIKDLHMEGCAIVMINRLKELRQARSLPMIGLSVKAGVSTTTIGAIERWDHVPGKDVQLRLAGALDVTVEEIWPQVAGFGSGGDKEAGVR